VRNKQDAPPQAVQKATPDAQNGHGFVFLATFGYPADDAILHAGRSPGSRI
jgi:hypothetical protein